MCRHNGLRPRPSLYKVLPYFVIYIEKNRAHSTTRFARFARQLWAGLKVGVAARAYPSVWSSTTVFISR